VRNPQYRTQFVVMIFGQIFLTTFFSLQWIIFYMYRTFTASRVKTYEENVIIYFVNTISLSIFYLNNVKAFYISLLTSQLFRKVFIKNVLKLFCRRHRIRVGITQTNTIRGTGTRNK